MFIKFFMLFFVLVIAILIGVRNIRRDFKPSLGARLELFWAGFPFGVLLMLFVIPELRTAIIFGIFTGVLTGIAYAYSLPRQWRFWNEKYRGHFKNAW